MARSLGVRIRGKIRVFRLRLQRFVLVVFTQPSQWRYLPEWLRSFRKGYLIDRQIPWLCFPAIEYLEAETPNSPRVFEYGSGASTLFWLRKGGTVTSVEHDAQWYKILLQLLGEESRVDYRLMEAEDLDPSIVPSPADPNVAHSGNEKYAHSDFTKYVTQIDEFPDEYFDVVVVDGRSRAACVGHAVPKVKPGGMLVLDNSNREYYLANTQHLLADFTRLRFWGLIPTVHVYDSTDIYIKRSA